MREHKRWIPQNKCELLHCSNVGITALNCRGWAPLPTCGWVFAERPEARGVSFLRKCRRCNCQAFLTITSPPTCRTCARTRRHAGAVPLWRNATQTVFGEGPASAQMMLVGEQPGDREDLSGRPFVGPAGHILDQALAAARRERDRSLPLVARPGDRPRAPAPDGCARGDGRGRADAAPRHHRAGTRASDRERVRGTCGLRSTRPTSYGSPTMLRANANLRASSKTWKAPRPWPETAASAHPDRGDKRRSGRYKRSLSPRGR